MSLLDGKPVPLHPKACGRCRWWAPWLHQQDFLGTCGHAGVNIGQCTDKHGTCDDFTEKLSPDAKILHGAVQTREFDVLSGMRDDAPKEPVK